MRCSSSQRFKTATFAKGKTMEIFKSGGRKSVEKEGFRAQNSVLNSTRH